MALPPPPMATPLTNAPGEGSKTQARVEMSNAVRALIKALSVLKDVSSEEAKSCITALKALEKVAPDVEEGVSQSEVQTMLQGAQTAMPGAGAGGMGLGRPPSPAMASGASLGSAPPPGM